MITVERAKALILGSVKPEKARVPLGEAGGLILAGDLTAPHDFPHWDNSAMDGFVLSSADVRRASVNAPVRLRLAGVVKAGDSRQRRLRSGAAMRIMTGAAIPAGADTVLAKEKAKTEGKVLVVGEPVPAGNHVRRRGEDLRRGSRFETRGRLVTPGMTGFLASLGKASVLVYRRPRVSVLATGSELVKPGKRLGPGHIYDSNAPMLEAALAHMGLAPAFVKTVPDRPDVIAGEVRRLLTASDVLILAGGVSVGDYDYVKEILEKNGARTVFWRIKQKPGKPLYFARVGKRLVFGLPGNPVSAYMCFYQYVYPALRAFMGFSDPFLPKADAGGLKGRRDEEKTVFTAVRRRGSKIEPLSHQGSHMVSALAETEGWIVAGPPKEKGKGGAEAALDWLPWTCGGVSR